MSAVEIICMWMLVGLLRVETIAHRIETNPRMRWETDVALAKAADLGHSRDKAAWILATTAVAVYMTLGPICYVIAAVGKLR